MLEHFQLVLVDADLVVDRAQVRGDLRQLAQHVLTVGVQQGTGPLTVSVEHPTGEFSVTLDSDPAHPDVVTKAALLRTARLLMRGEVMVPRSVWDGRRQD